MMAADTMEALGIPRGSYVVKVNNRKVLDGVMEAIGLGGDENAGRGSRCCAQSTSSTSFRPKFESCSVPDDGTAAKKARAISPRAPALARWMRHRFGGHAKARRRKEAIAAADTYLAKSAVGQAGVSELEEISKLVAASGYGSDRISIDPSVVRGLEYYTGPVYEVELTLETKDEKGRPVRFGSVGGGGRYDGLVSRFRGEPVPATGFSIGVSRLQAALTMLGKVDTKPAFGPVVVTVFGGEIADYQKMVATLRNAGIRAELYLGNPKHSLGQQMKYADRRNAPCAIVQGSDERANGKVQIKDLILGAGLTEIKDREEYLKKQTEAQYEVDRASSSKPCAKCWRGMT